MGEVVPFTGTTLLDTSPESVLDGAKEMGLEQVFVIGQRADGDVYAAGSTSDIGLVLRLFELFKREVI